MDDKNKRIESPCTGYCRWDLTMQYCIGCWRNVQDVNEWIRMSDTERGLSLRRCKRNKIKHLGRLMDQRANGVFEKK